MGQAYLATMPPGAETRSRIDASSTPRSLRQQHGQFNPSASLAHSGIERVDRAIATHNKLGT